MSLIIQFFQNFLFRWETWIFSRKQTSVPYGVHAEPSAAVNHKNGAFPVTEVVAGTCDLQDISKTFCKSVRIIAGFLPADFYLVIEGAAFF